MPPVFVLGAAILADEDQSRSAIGDGQNDRIAVPRPDRRHSDDEKFTDRLVKILQPQLRTDLGRRKSKTQLLGAGINLRQRRSLALKAECGHRDSKQLHARSAERKGRSSENFPSRVSDTAARRIERIDEGTNSGTSRPQSSSTPEHRRRS